MLHRDSVRLKGFVLAPAGGLAGRFDLTGEVTAYLADSELTALYESLFRREARNCHWDRLGERALTSFETVESVRLVDLSGIEEQFPVLQSLRYKSTQGFTASCTRRRSMPGMTARACSRRGSGSCGAPRGCRWCSQDRTGCTEAWCRPPAGRRFRSSGPDRLRLASCSLGYAAPGWVRRTFPAPCGHVATLSVAAMSFKGIRMQSTVRHALRGGSAADAAQRAAEVQARAAQLLYEALSLLRGSDTVQGRPVRGRGPAVVASRGLEPDRHAPLGGVRADGEGNVSALRQDRAARGHLVREGCPGLDCAASA